MALKKRVLFVCTGTRPEAIDQRALEVLESFGVATEGLRSKSVSAFIDQSFDFVITLCDKAHQECRNLPATTDTIAWDFEDPKTRVGSKSFNITLRELNERIKIFVLVQTKKR